MNEYFHFKYLQESGQVYLGLFLLASFLLYGLGAFLAAGLRRARVSLAERRRWCWLLGHGWRHRMANPAVYPIMCLKRECAWCGRVSQFLIFPSGRGEWEK